MQRREQLPRMLIIQLLPIWYFSSSLISNSLTTKALDCFLTSERDFFKKLFETHSNSWNCENGKSWGFKESIQLLQLLQLPHWCVTNWVTILGLRKIQAVEETLVQQLQWKNYLELFLQWT
jgi:hypothetical protein